MPTGYTYMITEKKATFEQFVWACARAFGALVHMRDDASGTPIRKEEESSYHDRELQSSMEELKKLGKITAKQAQAEADREFKLLTDEYHRALAKNEATRKQYVAMLEKVQAWAPPTPDHEGLKKFMMDQIVESIRFDCSYEPTKPEPITGKEWLERKRESLLRNIAYHTKNGHGDRERVRSRNKWIDDLAKSVPLPKEML